MNTEQMDYYPYIRYFEKYLQEELNEEETAEFNERLASDTAFSSAFKTFKNELLKESVEDVDSSYDKKKAWEHIQKNIYRSRLSPPTLKTEKTKYGVKIAAAFLIILFGGFMLVFHKKEAPEVMMITKVTETGQKATFTLSDGSRIRLNSESTLVYPENFNTDVRMVYLTGEAFFDVTKDPQRPFIVQSGNLQTHVLGTSFNIYAFPEEDLHQIAVKTGKIQISFPEYPAENVQLNMGELLQYVPSSQEWEKSQLDTENIAMWTDGYLYFDNEPLGNVLKTLSRWYGIDFEVKNAGLMNCHITLKQQNESLKNILEILKYAVGLEYELKDNKIMINGKPC